MTPLTLPSVKQIPTDNEKVYAFDVTGHVSDDDAAALADHMNDAFDRHDKVDMLLRLDGYTGSDKSAIFDSDVIASRWRSLSKVGRYAVIGAPDPAGKMIAFLDKLLPVDARSFTADDENAAWQFVAANPLPTG